MDRSFSVTSHQDNRDLAYEFPAAYGKSTVSIWPDQRSVNCQHPAAGMSMMDGPGPPATVRRCTAPTAVPPISCRAVISRDEPPVAGRFETQRILLERPGGVGVTSGSCRAQ